MNSGLTSSAPGAAPARRRRLAELPAGRNLEVRPASSMELPDLADLLLDKIPGLVAPFSSFARVHSHSKSIFSVINGGSIVGCFACLHLNDRGLERLLEGSLSMTEPDLSCLAESGEPAEAIYAWAWAMRPPTNGIKAMGSFMAWLERHQFAAAELYGRPATDKGFGFARNLDFQPVKNTMKNQGLWVTSRCA